MTDRSKETMQAAQSRAVPVVADTITGTTSGYTNAVTTEPKATARATSDAG